MQTSRDKCSTNRFFSILHGLSFERWPAWKKIQEFAPRSRANFLLLEIENAQARIKIIYILLSQGFFLSSFSSSRTVSTSR